MKNFLRIFGLLFLISSSVFSFVYAMEDLTVVMIRTFDVPSVEVTIGEEDVPILGFLLSANSVAHHIERIDVDFYADDDGDFDGEGDIGANSIIASASLYDDSGMLLVGPKVVTAEGNHYVAQFSSMNLQIDAGEQVKFVVKVDILSASAVDTAYIMAGLSINGITAWEEISANTTEIVGNNVGFGTDDDPVITVISGGELNVLMSSNSLNDSFLPEGTTGLLTLYEFVASGEDFNLDKLTIVNDLTGDFDFPENNCVIESVELDNAGEIFEKAFSDGMATFTDLNITIPADSSVYLALQANLNISDSCTEGDRTEAFRLGMKNVGNNAGTFLAIGGKSQTFIDDPVIKDSNLISVDNIVLPLSSAGALTLSKAINVSSKVYEAGDEGIELFSFIVEADEKTHYLKRVLVRFFADDDGSFDGGIGDESATNHIESVSLYDGNGNLVAGPESLRSINGYSDAYFETENYEISANTEELFIVKVDLLNVGDEEVYLAAGLEVDSTNPLSEDENENSSEIEGVDLNLGSVKSPKITKLAVDVPQVNTENNDDVVEVKIEMESEPEPEKDEAILKKESDEVMGDVIATLLSLKETHDQLAAILEDIEDLVAKIDSYNFSGTDEAILDSVQRFEVSILDEELTESGLEHQKALLLHRFELSKDAARVIKYEDGIIPFLDTDDDQWYTPYVIFAKEENVVGGYKDGSGNLTGEFKPGNNTTRAEILKMVLELAGYGEAAKSSIKTAHWSRFYMQKAQDLKLDFFDLVSSAPDQLVTRGEVIMLILDIFDEDVPDFVLYQLSDLHSPEGRFIQYAINKGIVDGYGDGTFRQDTSINRAEVSKILKNSFELLR